MDGDDLRPYAQLVQDRIDELKAQIPEDLGDKGIYYLAWGLSASRAVDHIDLLEKSNEQLVADGPIPPEKFDDYIDIEDHVSGVLVFLACWARDFIDEDESDEPEPLEVVR